MNDISINVKPQEAVEILSALQNYESTYVALEYKAVIQNIIDNISTQLVNQGFKISLTNTNTLTIGQKVSIINKDYSEAFLLGAGQKDGYAKICYIKNGKFEIDEIPLIFILPNQ